MTSIDTPDSLDRQGATAADAPASLGSEQAALVRIMTRLEAAGYVFVTPTPATAALVSGRREEARHGSLRDVFGWALPFSPESLPAPLLDDMRAAQALRAERPLLRSTVRVSTVDGRFFVHSAPGPQPDAVFLGPDSYRFIRFLRQRLGDRPSFRRAVDIGAGAGVGALTLAGLNPAAEVTAADINPPALRLLGANALHAGLKVKAVLGSGLQAVDGRFDLVVANPPYIAGEGGRTYRDGGGQRGAELALQWVREAVDRLNPGGSILLYTGSSIVEGRDTVREALEVIAEQSGLSLAHEEIDPDVFGGTLRQPAYADVERIAAIGAELRRPA